MKEYIKSDLDKKGYAKSSIAYKIGLVPAVALLVLQILSSTPALAGKKGGGEINSKADVGSLAINTKDQKTLAKIGLNESQIAQILSVQKRIATEKASGNLPKDFEMKITDKITMKVPESSVSIASKPKDNFKPIEASPNNSREFFAQIFDKKTTNDFIDKISSLNEKEKDELRQKIYSDNVLTLISGDKDKEVFGDGFLYSWFDKFKQAAPRLKYKNIINHQRLLKLTYMITKFQFMNSRGLTTKQLSTKEINQLEVSFALQTVLYLLENKNIRFVKISFVPTDSQDLESEWANIFIVGEDGLAMFDITTTKTIGVFLDSFSEIRRKKSKSF